MCFQCARGEAGGPRRQTGRSRPGGPRSSGRPSAVWVRDAGKAGCLADRQRDHQRRQGRDLLRWPRPRVTEPVGSRQLILGHQRDPSCSTIRDQWKRPARTQPRQQDIPLSRDQPLEPRQRALGRSGIEQPLRLRDASPRGPQQRPRCHEGAHRQAPVAQCTCTQRWDVDRPGLAVIQPLPGVGITTGEHRRRSLRCRSRQASGLRVAASHR